MEDTLTIAQNQPDAAPVGKKTKFFRIAAFSSYVLGIVWEFVGFPILSAFTNDFQSWHEYSGYVLKFIPFLYWGLLALIAPNKPVRIATCLLAMLPVLFFGIFELIPKDALNVHANVLLMTARNIIGIYLFSLIMMNASFTPKETGWINLLVIMYCINTIWIVIHQYVYLPAFRENTFEFEQAYNASLYYGLQVFIIYCILYPIAFYKLCFSNAFSGKYDKEAQTRYTPLNKYLIGGAVVSSVACGLLYLVFLFTDEITNLL